MKKSFKNMFLFFLSFVMLSQFSFVNVLAVTAAGETSNTNNSGIQAASTTAAATYANASTMGELKTKLVDNLIKKQQVISINYSGADNASRISYGDLNGDRHVNSIDMALMKRYILGIITAFPSPDGLKAADVNSDGAINSVDYELLKKFISGTINKLPAAIDFNQEISNLVKTTLDQDPNRYSVKSSSYNITGQQGNYIIYFNFTYNVPKTICSEYSKYNFECNKEQTVNFFVYDDSNNIVPKEQCTITANGSAVADSTVVTNQNGMGSIKISDSLQENVVLNIGTSNGIKVGILISFVDVNPPAATVITGVYNGVTYDKAVIPSWTDAAGTTSTATLNGAAYTKGTQVNTYGEYTLIVTSKKASNGLTSQTTVRFTIVQAAQDVTYSNGIILDKDTTINGNLFVTGGIIDLAGHKLTVAGNLMQSGGMMKINQGKLVVGGDYRIQSFSNNVYGNSNGILQMINDTDYVLVNGSFVTQGSAYSDGGNLTAGVLEVKGDFTQIENNPPNGYVNNFAATGTNIVRLSGSKLQTVSFDTSSPRASHFNILVIANEGDGVTFKTPIDFTDVRNVSNNIKGDVTTASSWKLNSDEVINGNLYILSDIDLNGYSLTIGGNLMQPSGTMHINKGKLTVNGDYRIQSYARDGYGNSSGILQMINDTDYVLVNGSFVTQGSSHSSGGDLTAGVLEVKGDFVQKANNDINEGIINFAATGTNIVRLSGSKLQTVSFDTSSPRASHFNILVIANEGDGVAFKTPIDFTDLRNVSNNIKSDVMTVSSWKLTSDEVINGNFYIVSDIDLNGHSLTIGGNLIQRSGIMHINNGKLTVNGDYRIQDVTSDGYGNSDGILQMIKDTDYVLVNGSFVTQGSVNSSEGDLTAGVLEVKGDFIQKVNSNINGGANNFAATGTNIVRLSGSTLQAVSFDTSSPRASHFNILVIANQGDGVEFKTPIDFTDIRNVSNNIKSDVMTVSSWKLTSDEVINGNFYIVSDIDLNGHSLTIGGNLIQRSGIMHINNGKLTVNGDYRIQDVTSDGYGNSDGILQMINDTDYVLVNGSFVTQGSSHSGGGDLTAGVLEVKGDFTQKVNDNSNGGVNNFAATGTNIVRLSGSTLQTVSFDTSSPRASHFNILVIANERDGVAFKTPIDFTDIRNVSNNIKSDVMTVSSWKLTSDEVINGNFYIVSDIDLNGHSLTIGGDLIQRSGIMHINNGKLTVNGDYRIQDVTSDGYGNSDGILQMINDTDYVLVNGSFVTQGSSHSGGGDLTAGVLEVKGDFTQKVNDNSNGGVNNFAATGTNIVRLSGSTLQTVSFDTPSPMGSHFNILVIANNGDGVVYKTPIYYTDIRK